MPREVDLDLEEPAALRAPLAFGVADIVVRDVAADEVPVLRAVLRRDGAYRRAGLVTVPADDGWGVPLEVDRPGGRRATRPGCAWVLAGGRLRGAWVEYGWDTPEDPVRLVTRLGLDAAGCGEAELAAFFAWLRRHKRVRAVRGGAELAAAGGAELRQGEVVWRHLAVEAIERLVAPARAVAALGLRADDRAVYGPFGDGGRRLARLPRAGQVVVHDPSAAHWALAQGGGWQRRLFYPEAGAAERADVVVVGAGLAGLAAAYALGKAGRRTLVLERGDRLGGTAAAVDGLQGRFAIGAHYECEPDLGFGPEVLALYQELGWIERQPVAGGERYPFREPQHYVAPELGDQAIYQSGRLRRRGWSQLYADPVGRRFRDLVLVRRGQYRLPTRYSSEAARREASVPLGAWLQEQGFARGGELEAGLDVLLRSDYGGSVDDVSAFAGLHYFACRPYLVGGTRTFSPPEGLAWFAERLHAAAEGLELRTGCMARRLVDRRDAVEVVALDLAARRSRRILAQAVVVASPKKALPYLFPADAPLFATNVYAAWITVTFELDGLPERDALDWANHVWEPTGTYVGFTWANHHDPAAAPVLTHYLVFPPGRAGHVRALLARPAALIRLCAEQTRAVLGQDPMPRVRRVTIQKLGHAMPTPVPGSLFLDPNRRRTSRRIVYAGVDTGRLPLMAEALDSGLEAAREVLEATGG